jgi:hypothetical protein
MNGLILFVVALLHCVVGASGARALRVTAAGPSTSIVEVSSISPSPSPPPKSESVDAVDLTNRPFCVSDENSLRAQLLQGGTVYMCHGSNIVVNKTFYITDTSFELRCRGQRIAGPVDEGSGDLPATPCILSGKYKIRLFQGNRNQAKFYDITFKDGYVGSSGRGGALRFYTSDVEVVRCVFTGNRARVRSNTLSCSHHKLWMFS